MAAPKAPGAPALSLVRGPVAGVNSDVTRLASARVRRDAHGTSAVKPQVTLTRAAELDLDQAELFLLGLDQELRADTPRTAYLLGLAEGHIANLIELLRAVSR
jgi:hypothetical protein